MDHVGVGINAQRRLIALFAVVLLMTEEDIVNIFVLELMTPSTTLESKNLLLLMEIVVASILKILVAFMLKLLMGKNILFGNQVRYRSCRGINH